jgi:hypothetical protein
MKDSPDAKEKTSRRSFAKTVATALIAAPVVSSLSSCAQPSGTPSPTPSPQPSPRVRTYGANPPVIIDGGSFQIAIPATLIRELNTDPPIPPDPPKKHLYKFKQTPNNPLGAIKGIFIIDDYAYQLLPEYTLSNNQTLQVHIWVAKVETEAEDPNNDTDTVGYEDISAHAHPDIIIQGGKIEIKMDKNITFDKKLLKRETRNPKRYYIHDWEQRKPFRIAQVKVFVSGNPQAIFSSQPGDLDNGFRITLIF